MGGLAWNEAKHRNTPPQPTVDYGGTIHYTRTPFHGIHENEVVNKGCTRKKGKMWPITTTTTTTTTCKPQQQTTTRQGKAKQRRAVGRQTHRRSNTNEGSQCL